MSQRKALIASILLTLILALSAIGIRAAMVDSPDDTAGAKGSLPLVVAGDDREGDDEYDDERDDDEDRDSEYASSWGDDDRDGHGGAGLALVSLGIARHREPPYVPCATTSGGSAACASAGA